jgi:hypothetical protein
MFVLTNDGTEGGSESILVNVDGKSIGPVSGKELMVGNDIYDSLG